MAQWVPTTAIPAPRWPNLVAAVGGDARIREFTAASAGADGPAGSRRWEQGFVFSPYGCPDDNDLQDPTCASSVTIEDTSFPADVTGVPWALIHRARCSTFGDPDRVQAAATSLLLATTSHKLETEFWTGARAKATGRGGHYLTDTNVTLINGGTALPLVQGFGILQNEIGAVAQGMLTFLHMTPMTATLLLSQQAIRWDGGLLRDGMGNIVVAGTGYDGSSPTDVVDATEDTAWVYATTVPDLRLSEVQTTAPRVIESVDPRNNVQYATAYRFGSVSFDPCVQLGANLALCEIFCQAG